jgi:predicted transposase/invertase (TIGR01784 family)
MSTAEMLIARGKAQGKEEGKAEGISQGISQGKAQGELAEKLAIAKRLKKLGMPMAQLCQATGLSEEEAAAL